LILFFQGKEGKKVPKVLKVPRVPKVLKVTGVLEIPNPNNHHTERTDVNFLFYHEAHEACYILNSFDFVLKKSYTPYYN